MEIDGDKIKISPSLICMDFLEIRRQIEILNKFADSYHCDIMDNHFVPALGLPFEFIIDLKKITILPIDVHVMVENVETIVDKLIQIGVDTITIHIEGITSNAFRVIGKIKDAGIKVGIAINPITSLQNLTYILAFADKITVMTFDPGLPGQKLVNITLDKIKNLNEIKMKNRYSFDIEVDGSCNERNFSKMRKSGANQYVVGKSGLFSLDIDMETAWKMMKKYMDA